MPNPFGKYPRSSALKKYIESTKHYYALSTQAERERKIRYVCSIIESLGASDNPASIDEKHIYAFLGWMEKTALENESKRKLLRFLRDYLSFHGNDIIHKMLSSKRIRMPGTISKEIRSLPIETVKAIHEPTKLFDGWEGSIARFITLAYPYTGLRPSELRTLKFRDVDLATWTLVVSHPKGEDRYGKNRRIGILHPLRTALMNFLYERKVYLEEHGYNENEEPLIPHIGKKGLSYWTHQQFLLIKANIECVSGIRFKLKDYRASFCQYAIDQGADLQAVSKVMGHKTTMTTESYYGRIRDDAAIAEIERVFSEPNIPKVNSLVN